MHSCELILVERDADRAAYHRIRRAVLFGNGPDYVEDGPEERKPENLSLIFKHGGAPIGTVRLDPRAGGKAIVRLVAIDADAQRQGHGSELMRQVEGLAAAMGIRELLVHARPDAVGFYERIGYMHAPFAEADGSGIQMRKSIEDGVLAHIIGLEESLFDGSARGNREAVASILTDDFTEIGRSGGVYDKTAIVESLAADAPQTDHSVRGCDYSIRWLCPEVALLSYRSTRREGEVEVHTLRSSIWRQAEGRWQMTFHQGTPTR